MGKVLETLGFRVANPSSTFTAVTMATGDSATLRNFRQGSNARLEHVARQGATSGAWRILSAVLHDNVVGLTFIASETPTSFMMPDFVGEPMQPGDTLTIQGTGGTNETEVGTITVYYEDYSGIDAKLYRWEDIRPAIEHLYTNEIDVTIGGTAGVWTDTLLNNTTKQQKADRYYAVLGYLTDTALAAVGVKGGATGNVRAAGPGVAIGVDTAFWYILESNRLGTPHIPVIAANDFGAAYLSVLTTATSGTAKITLTMALLRAGFQ